VQYISLRVSRRQRQCRACSVGDPWVLSHTRRPVIWRRKRRVFASIPRLCRGALIPVGVRRHGALATAAPVARAAPRRSAAAARQRAGCGAHQPQGWCIVSAGGASARQRQHASAAALPGSSPLLAQRGHAQCWYRSTPRRSINPRMILTRMTCCGTMHGVMRCSAVTGVGIGRHERVRSRQCASPHEAPGSSDTEGR